MTRTTHTLATLALSPAAYYEIAAKLKAAGYEHAVGPDGVIDMSGIGVERQPYPEGWPIDLVVHDPEEPDEMQDPAYRRALKRVIVKAAVERGETAIRDWTEFDAAIYKALRGSPYQCVTDATGNRKIVVRRPR